MDELRLLFRYATRLLIWIAPVEFLLGRAISRASRQMPAGDVGAAIFSTIGSAGAFLVMPAFVLVLLVLVLAAVEVLRGDSGVGAEMPKGLALLILVLLAFSAGSLSPGTSAPMLLVYNLMSAAVVLWIAGLFVLRGRPWTAARVTVGLFALAYAGYYVYAGAAILAQGTGAELGEIGVWANAMGEAAGMAAAISLLWTSGLLRRGGGQQQRRLWLGLAGLALIVVLVAALFEEWLQGVAAQFSVGFTLFLPVPVTALALAAWVYATLAANSRAGRQTTGLPWAWEFGAGMLLLPAAGYALQLNYQHLLLVATFLLLTGTIRPFSRAVPSASSEQPVATAGAERAGG